MTAYAFKRGTPFWERVERMPNGCLEWQGSRNLARNGYGQLRVDGTAIFAHRRAWELIYGPIPSGLFVCHRCDNPPCCEPTHLFLGTARDNGMDASTKGRLAGLQAGETHAQAKFTDVQVAAMRSMRQGGALLSAIADKFNAEVSYVSRLCRKEVRP